MTPPRRHENEDKYYIDLNQGATCCADGHQTFYGAVVTSPYWGLWRKHTTAYDTVECEECGWLSDGHFQAFLEFVAGIIERKDMK